MPMSNKGVAVLVGCLGFGILSVLACGGLVLGLLITRVEYSTRPAPPIVVPSQPFTPVQPDRLPTTPGHEEALDRHATPPDEAGKTPTPVPATTPSDTKDPPKAEQENDPTP